MPLGITSGHPLHRIWISFLDKLRSLNDGVIAYNMCTTKAFLLKAHLVLIIGDIPTVSRLLYLSGHIGNILVLLANSKAHHMSSKQKQEMRPREDAILLSTEPPNKFPQHLCNLQIKVLSMKIIRQISSPWMVRSIWKHLMMKPFRHQVNLIF